MEKEIRIPFKSYLLRKNGYINVQKLAEERNFIENKDSSLSNFKILNKDNKQIITKFKNIEKDTIYKIETSLGGYFYATKDNCFLTLTNKGNLEYKNFLNLKKNDIIISNVGSELSNTNVLINEENSYLIGYLYAINFLELINTDNDKIEIPVNPFLIDFLKELLMNKFDIVCEDNKLFIYNSKLSIDNYITQNNISKDFIPKDIFNGPIENQIAFIRGYYDVFTIFKNNKIIKECISETFIIELMLMLNNVGIIANYDNDIIIKGEEIINFYNFIGFKNFTYEENILEFNLRQEDFYVIPTINKIVDRYIDSLKESVSFNFEYTRDSIRRIIELDGNSSLKEKLMDLIDENVCYVKINSIEELANENVLILNIDEDEHYILNNVIYK